MPKSEQFQKLPAPWDRIFSLGTRTFVWVLLIGILYILRPFFLLIFLTFVFAYIQTHGVEGLEHRIRSRVSRVIFVFMVLLGVIIGTGYFIGPKIKDQADTFIARYPGYLRAVDKAIYDVADTFPPLRKMILGEKDTGDEKVTSDEKDGSTKSNGERAGDREPGQDPGQPPIQGPAVPKPPIVEKLLDQLSGEGGLKKTVGYLQQAVGWVLAIGSAFLLSLLFSFLIVLDLPKLTRGIRGLANTKIGFIYNEVAENIHDFGRVVGRALEAQLLIAIVNTILTGIGLYSMGLPNIVFLCTIVFFCSFVPVAGVFMSSVPICLVSLQQDGISLMLLAIALILIIHFIEAYFLNPKIYGHHLRMNAVLVLIILTICGKLFGVWGLVLGLPVTNYFFAIAIQHDEDDEPGAKGGKMDKASQTRPAQPERTKT